jgi:FlaG/FlaF family flagellin (archaellin)
VRTHPKSPVALVWTLAALMLVVTAGCSREGKTPTPSTEPAPTSSPTAASTPTVDPRIAAASKAALAAYSGYVTAYAAAAAVANPDDPNLARYIGGALLVLSRHNLRQLKDHGAIELGRPKATLIGNRTDLGGSPPTVTIEACVDYSDYQLVYKADRSPVPGSSLKVPRYRTTAKVTLFVDGRWLVAGDNPHRDVPC